MAPIFAGGALACLAVVPLLNWLGGPNAILFAGAVAATAAIIWATPGNAKKLAFGIGGLLLMLIAANYSGRLIDVVYAKGIFRDASWVEFARWNAISRVEVDRQGGAKAVVIDADASTYIMNADLNHWQGTDWEKNLCPRHPRWQMCCARTATTPSSARRRGRRFAGRGQRQPTVSLGSKSIRSSPTLSCVIAMRIIPIICMSDRTSTST